MSYTSMVKLTHLDEKMVNRILYEYKIHHCELLIREDITVDDLIDVIEGNRRYVKCLYVYNKVDVCSIQEVDQIARREMSIPISCYQKLNLDGLLVRLWAEMQMVRVYTKKVGKKPDFEEPVVLTPDRGGVDVGRLCDNVHRDLRKELKYALVWGRSSKHNPQRCGVAHELADEDVVQLVKKKNVISGELRGRFKQTSDKPLRISDREKKAKLKT